MTPADLHREWCAAKGPPELYVSWLERQLIAARGDDETPTFMLFVQGKGYRVHWLEMRDCELKTGGLVTAEELEELRTLLDGQVYLMVTAGENVIVEGTYVARGSFDWSGPGHKFEIQAARVVSRCEQQASCQRSDS